MKRLSKILMIFMITVLMVGFNSVKADQNKTELDKFIGILKGDEKYDSVYYWNGVNGGYLDIYIEAYSMAITNIENWKEDIPRECWGEYIDFLNAMANSSCAKDYDDADNDGKSDGRLDAIKGRFNEVEEAEKELSNEEKEKLEEGKESVEESENTIKEKADAKKKEKEGAEKKVSIYKAPERTGKVEGGAEAGDGVEQIMEDADSFLDKGADDQIDEGKLQDTFSYIYNIFLQIGIVASVIVGAILGIKFMTSSIEEKAEVKKMLVVYVVACIAVFGSFGIWKLLVNILSDL